jgi:hypothetical protein
MSEITTFDPAPASEADQYTCCDPKSCEGCGCCADDKGGATSCC